MNPMISDMIEQLQLYPCSQSLYRRVAELVEARILYITGFVGNERGTGRTRTVWATQKFKQDTLATHELPLSKLILAWRVPCVRGKFVDSRLLPDATIYDCLHVELDTGKIDLPRAVQRLRKYESVDDPVLFVTRSAARLDRVLERGEFLAGRLVGCTYEAALNAPSDVRLTHCDGDQISLDELLKIVLENPGITRDPARPQVPLAECLPVQTMSRLPPSTTTIS